jgi:ATP-dependent DNA helicase PIF1
MTQEQAFKIMKTGVNVYLTGSAGSGKTYLLNKYISYLKEHDISVAITASTGIASTHMNGMTIHGWSGIGIKEIMGEKELEQLEEKKYLWKRFEKARVLIIDEISMLHGYQLEMVEKVCRRFKRNEKPFGGLQVILSGDFFQLPPVSKMNQENKMVYESFAWQKLNPAICYISEQHRQEDDILLEILNTIRYNNIEDKHYTYLNQRIGASLGDDIKATKLYTHNINVDDENFNELAKIDGQEKVYEMISSGKDILVEILKKGCLAHERLCLKIGAEIMCLKNNFEEGYVNGSRGKVVEFNIDGAPIIELYNGKKIKVKPEIWAIEEDGKIKASISQLPLRLAWAITIHKSQGMSLDNAEIDLSNSFAYGMGYVALSRVRTLSGIKLIGFNKESFKVDPKVLVFDEQLRQQSQSNEILFKKLKKEDQDKMEMDFIIRMGGKIHTINKKKNSVGQEKADKKYSVENIRQKYPNAYRPWKEDDDTILRQLFKKGDTINELSKKFGRQRGSINARLIKLGLIEE